ncbi:MAG: PIN/TRAM domain-containing protein, partial [Phycisphaerales bacterium]
MLGASRIRPMPRESPEEPIAMTPRSPRTPHDRVGSGGRRGNRVLMLAIRLLFMVLLMAVTLLTLASQATPGDFGSSTFVGLLVAAAALGLVVVLADAVTPNKRLTSVVAVYLGICFGLIGALAIGAIIDQVSRAWELERGPAAIYLQLAKAVIGIILCYLSVSVVLSTKDDFRLVIPYVEFSRQARGVLPMVVDTSVLVDGRIDELGHTGFLDAPLIVPQFVIDELQALADSSDRSKRSRGRRGLDTVRRLQANAHLDVSVEERQIEGVSVDHKLLELCRLEGFRILTTDSNLKKVGEIKGIAALNLNDLAGTLRTGVSTGDRFAVAIVKAGENPGQGVGFLPDGTMVVVEDAAAQIGETLMIVVSNTLQTSAGRLIFAKPIGESSDESAAGESSPHAAEPAPRSFAEQMARAAVEQPRRSERPPRHDPPPPGRNPRG